MSSSSSSSNDEIPSMIVADQDEKSMKQEPPKFDEKDQVEVPLNQFLTLLSAYDTYSNVLDDISTSQAKEPPFKHMLQEMDIEGKTEKDKVTLKCKLCVMVLVDKYAKFKLFNVNEKFTVLDYSVQKEKNVKPVDTTNGNISTYFERDQEEEVALENNVGFIGVFDNSYCLHTNEKGRYHVTLNLCVPYQTDQKKSLEINFPFTTPRNHLRRFEIDGDYYDIHVEPSSGFKTKFEESNRKKRTILTDCLFPPTHKLSLYWTRSEKVIQEILKAQKVNEKVEKKEEKKEEKQLNVSVDQHVLHSIGNGLISSSVDMDYTIVNGSVNTLFVLFQFKTSPQDKFNDKDACPIRILKVEGRNIKNWEVKKLKSNTAQSNAPRQAVNDNQSESNYSIQLLNSVHSDNTNSSFLQTAANYGDFFLKVTLDTGVEGSYQLRLLAERDTSESCKTHLPTFSCMNVNRDKGFVGIEAVQNVEINELKYVGFTKLAPTELPQKITSKACDSLLFGYKFLQSVGNDLFLEIKKHDEVAVLVAVIQEAVFTVTYSDSGFLFYYVAMKVKNSSQNYARVQLVPPGVKYSLFSTSVKSEIVRPAIDKEGNILVPLKRGTSDMIFSVELFYTVPVSELMKDSGRLEVVLPKFNIPTNKSYYVVNLPDNYNYGEFEGSMKEVNSFDTTPTVKSLISTEASSAHSLGGYNISNSIRPQAKQQLQQQQPMMQMMSNVYMPQSNVYSPPPQMQYQQQARNISRNRSSSPGFFEEDERAYSDDELAYSDEDEDDSASDSGSEDGFGGASSSNITSNGPSGMVTGVMPVKLQAISTGRPFLFQKMLISENEDHLKLSVEYKKQIESVLNKRTLLPVTEAFWGVSLIFIGFVLYLLFCLISYFL
ncbi:predicted protein [Naegleria gruberi]|uniref:Predicted protein n=1 Tax=Naegleria gruberi TaxID=5762 RepID=D2VST5_NAEGR|nr:uncharacterized protein NAEGRDRAFT_81109 [Naegleria gruberi]EFC40251.1 predicted protein [Naegleria gruberi]|eukprot:XP_002672995.1 predicted protein [Naegleria gruberi strain NEG-M]